ncbi:neuroendocrine protein 7B2 isoform X1 [Halyomorpha halys]|uniref:neuroendocrine protein 7B2 isoform X1 n=1 Tax=Halyomorpha halys TaxID=286706 RepID=UPI0006D4D541|nr:neuroendocrine protein 7B2 isoform X1 [Halyomorpha halys]
MGLASLLLLGVCAMSTHAYLPPMKEHFLPEALLREVMELEGYLEDPAYPQLRSGDYQENPTVRDHEYLQHSSLWANPFISDNNENNNLPGIQRPENKQETLPAYCDPPNPCPIGYTAEEGCLEEFENTAAFSREYQARQNCMCDSEHMFDCAANRNANEITESDFDRLVQHFHVDEGHKSLVAKKYHMKKSVNPYLEGERLPVAAKKGIHIGN